MNSFLDTATSCARWLAAQPRRVLAVLDRCSLRSEYRHLWQMAAAQDAWYVQSAGEIIGPERTEDLLQRLAAGQSPLAVVHASAFEGADPEWQILRHESWCNDRATVAVWFIAFWTPAILLLAWPLAALLRWL